MIIASATDGKRAPGTRPLAGIDEYDCEREATRDV